MKKRDELIIRLLQESSFNVKVLIRDRQGNTLPVESVRLSDAQVPKIQASMEGPLAHNEVILVIEAGSPIRDVEVE